MDHLNLGDNVCCLTNPRGQQTCSIAIWSAAPGEYLLLPAVSASVCSLTADACNQQHCLCLRNIKPFLWVRSSLCRIHLKGCDISLTQTVPLIACIGPNASTSSWQWEIFTSSSWPDCNWTGEFTYDKYVAFTSNERANSAYTTITSENGFKFRLWWQQSYNPATFCWPGQWSSILLFPIFASFNSTTTWVFPNFLKQDKISYIFSTIIRIVFLLFRARRIIQFTFQSCHRVF